MAITASLVKELRERTGAGMMECKKFLVETDGDIEKAIEEMRKRGAAKAAKKEGRTTAEGIIINKVSDDNKCAVILEVNCETDFVARGDDFVNFANHVAERALAEKATSIDALLELAYNAGSDETIEKTRQDLIAKIGENINIRRLELIEAEESVGAYSHGVRIGVIVNVKGGNGQLNKDIAMHIAASSPVVVSQDQVPAELVAKEKEIFSAQAAESGKPAEIIEKMVEGRLKKFLDEVSLHGQPFVKDPNTTINKLLQEAGAEVLSFVRFEVGEGIEKKEENFAEEVMAQIRGSE
ncbi:MAG: elongation factor Ts [Legionellales bacterium]|nr:elongation factor Ts [Legionellales bacterium]|tara:strand:+ start:55004 stop:55891 length:888 start_codon:yes stop_codon:yes gene_type:complete